jgi:hypothetical protein
MSGTRTQLKWQVCLFFMMSCTFHSTATFLVCRVPCVLYLWSPDYNQWLQATIWTCRVCMHSTPLLFFPTPLTATQLELKPLSLGPWMEEHHSKLCLVHYSKIVLAWGFYLPAPVIQGHIHRGWVWFKLPMWVLEFWSHCNGQCTSLSGA